MPFQASCLRASWKIVIDPNSPKTCSATAHAMRACLSHRTEASGLVCYLMTIWSFVVGWVMRTVPVVEAKARFSALLAAAEAGEEVAITRRGKVIARLVPDAPRSAAEVFRSVWRDQSLDLDAPVDSTPQAVDAWD